MRAVVQRVRQATVAINGEERSRIAHGLLVLLGIEVDDTPGDVEWLCGKIARMRIFADEAGLMNRDINDVGGQLLLVSQFTLHASTAKGNRPSYIRAARPEKAIPLYEGAKSHLVGSVRAGVFTGEFGADMQVTLVNDGPVTIIIDSKDRE